MIMGVTEYRGVQKLYFERILKCCRDLGKFYEFQNQNLLDFGCGTKELRKFTSTMNYHGYDQDSQLTEIQNWSLVNFHTVVINHTLMYLDKNEICDLFEKLSKSPSLKQVIIGIGRQNTLSKIGQKILGKSNAHQGTVTGPREQLELVNSYFSLVRSKSVFFMTDVLLLVPRSKL